MGCFYICSSHWHPLGSMQNWWAPLPVKWPQKSCITHWWLLGLWWRHLSQVWSWLRSERLTSTLCTLIMSYMPSAFSQFLQFLKCVIRVDTCLVILLSFNQKEWELYEIIFKAWGVTLHIAQGGHCTPRPCRNSKAALDGVLRNLVSLQNWAWFEQGVRQPPETPCKWNYCMINGHEHLGVSLFFCL